MLRRVLTSKPLRYTVGSTLLLHPPAYTTVRSPPYSGKLRSLSWLEKSQWQLETLPLLPQNFEDGRTVFGWRALHQAVTIPTPPPSDWMYRSTGLPALILQLRLPVTEVKRRPIGGY